MHNKFHILGRIYDKNGNMKQWWTNETIIEYNNRSSCFVKQYNDYLVTETFEYVSIQNDHVYHFVAEKKKIVIDFFPGFSDRW